MERGDRLHPGLDDDEESPTFPFTRFEDLLALSYLSRIRYPSESHFELHDWMFQRTPHWRWAQAHFLLKCGTRWDFRNADEHTKWAADLLRRRARGTVPHIGVKRLVDAIVVYEQNHRTRWLLEAHLLLPELPANLPSKLGLAPATIEYYTHWFFDVRSRLSSSSWIACHALGGSPWNGFADQDLAPVWKRMAYRCKCERVLDITVAVTTGVGRERFTPEECDDIQLVIEQMRLSPIFEPDRVLQIDRRLRAERAGEHPSAYHMRRRLKATGPAGPTTQSTVVVH